MDSLPIADRGLQQTSACPVHFCWDGRGWGRPVVRLSFLGVILAGMLHTTGRLAHMPSLIPAAVGLFSASAVGWVVGQILSRVSVWRARRS